MAEVIELADHRPGWIVCRCKCRSCGYAEGIHVVHVDCDLDRTECPACGAMASAVTHIDHAAPGAPADWRPRLELVQ